MKELDTFRTFLIKPLGEGMSHSGIEKQIEDIEDSLDSGESDGEPLTNETEMELQKELKRLKSQISESEYVSEGKGDNLWTSYIKSVINDIRLNGIGMYGDAGEDDILEDFENYIAEKY